MARLLDNEIPITRHLNHTKHLRSSQRCSFQLNCFFWFDWNELRTCCKSWSFSSVKCVDATIPNWLNLGKRIANDDPIFFSTIHDWTEPSNAWCSASVDDVTICFRIDGDSFNDKICCCNEKWTIFVVESIDITHASNCDRKKSNNKTHFDVC